MTISHIQYLKCTKHVVKLVGKDVQVWRLNIPDDESVLSSWASHFRNHYCLDRDLDDLRAGTGLSRREYLIDLVFPDSSKAPGPSVRAGDFAEVLVSDYLEYHTGYWVPRDKYAEKATRNESIKGVDVIGFQLADGNPESQNPQDVFIAFEVKAKLVAKKYEGTLQDAIDHSEKDSFRRALTLNAAKRRLLIQGRYDESLIVQRFQNPTDHPYSFRSGAAAVISDDSYDEQQITQETIISGHSNAEQLELMIIQGSDLMDLVTAIYERAANEA